MILKNKIILITGINFKSTSNRFHFITKLKKISTGEYAQKIKLK